MFEYSDELLQASLWANRARFGAVEEVIASLQGPPEGVEERLLSHPIDSGGRGRSFFEILWDRVLDEKDNKPAQWAKAVELMAAAGHRVNHRLPSGRLPLAELASWGPAFWGACQAFCDAGANAFKKDARRVSALDAARSAKALHAPWAKEASRSHDRFATDSAKEDLLHNDLHGPEEELVGASEWAERFAWEAQKGLLSFDLNCAHAMARRFSPAEALAAWRAALGGSRPNQKEFAAWALACVCDDLPGLPTREAIADARREDFSARLGDAAVERGKRDGSDRDPELAARLIERLMRASGAFGADFHRAAQPLADQALSWKLPCAYSADPYAKAFMGDQLLAALERGYAQWERSLIHESLPEPSSRSAAPRL